MKKLTITFSLCFIVFACSDDFLNESPQDRVSETSVWSDPSLITAYHNGLYNAIPHGFSRHMISKYTDEAFSNGDRVQVNTFDADVIGRYNGNNNHLYYYARAYDYVRKINVFLEEMEGSEIMDNKEVLIGEAKFIRAFIYFELIRRFGGVPLVDQSYGLGDDIDFERNTFEECVAFINNDLDDAMAVLPESHPASSSDFGRGTQDACQALRSRLLLYAASPLFNPSGDTGKWQLAADAAEALLDAGYSLFPDYRQMFIQPSGSENSGLIFARNFSTVNSHQAPIINMNRRYGGYGGWSASNGPTQNLVDSYPMTNGELPFLDDISDQNINPASGYDPQNPYSNRDPRLDATVLHQGSVYRGDTLQMWISQDESTFGFDSFRESGDNPRSNYALKKFAPDEDLSLSFETPYTMPWIYFRLAEIYLNYAEAKFELGDEATCRQYINMVRARASVNTAPVGDDVSGEDLRRVLYNERQVEFAFEGQRFFDTRRWKLDNEKLSTDLRGMDVVKNTDTDELIYSSFVLGQREPFEDKMYLLPIATDEILRNGGSLEQTEGW